eukprot:445367_1
MSVQNATKQLMNVEKSQMKLEMQIKTFQSVLSKLQGDKWETHFTSQLTTIKQQVGEMEKLLIKREKENKRLKQERDLAKKEVDDLSKKLKESQTIDEQKQSKQSEQPMRCGGLNDREIDDNIKLIVDKIKEQVINKSKSDNKNYNFDEFIAIEAKSQVVAGINWFLKIRISNKLCIHVKVWAKLNKEYELCNIQYNKTETDLLDPF